MFISPAFTYLHLGATAALTKSFNLHNRDFISRDPAHPCPATNGVRPRILTSYNWRPTKSETALSEFGMMLLQFCSSPELLFLT